MSGRCSNAFNFFLATAMGFLAPNCYLSAFADVETSQKSERAFDIFHGERQRFGHLGEPQRWINVLGNIGGSEELASLAFSLNDATTRPLSIGANLHRLAAAGDFNVELAWGDLREGRNDLRLKAGYHDGESISTKVELHVERNRKWPLPYHVDFAKLGHLQDAVQVVDGDWELNGDGARTAAPSYDRVLSMGDATWTNYQATVRLTLHGYAPSQAGPPTYNVTHFGVAFRWQGHTQDGRQPSRRWHPLGAQGEFLIKNDLIKNQFRILNKGGPGWTPTYSESRNAVRLNHPFYIKAQVDELENGNSVYRFKQWNEGEPEPAAWAVESIESRETDLPSGSLCLVAHNTDVTIHEVSIESLDPPDPWPKGVRVAGVPSTADGSLQKALFESASRSEPRPLLVALHSWSGDYRQRSGTDYLEQCRKRAWHFIHPDFRGVNQTPQAVCSDLAVTDILDAVEFAKANADVDESRVYLVGASGGGMAALQMLAKAPEVWAGVSAWVPISDLPAWHGETALRQLKYTAMIEAACGGPPGANAAVDFQYRNRSPLFFLNSSIQAPLDLNAGIHDGHTGSVPISHSLRAFNALAEPEDRIDGSLIKTWTKSASILDEWKWNSFDPAYVEKPVLFRRQSNAARLTVFEGGHEIIPEAAFTWLEKQTRDPSAALKR